MKKVHLILLIITPIIFISARSIFASDSADDINPLVPQAISLNEKLKTCTPTKSEVSGSKTEIYGVKKGMCRFSVENPDGSSIMNRQTGERIDITNCDYSVPIEDVRQYAINNIRLIKSMYQIDNIALSRAEIIEIGNNEFEFAKKYCN